LVWLNDSAALVFGGIATPVESGATYLFNPLSRTWIQLPQVEVSPVGWVSTSVVTTATDPASPDPYYVVATIASSRLGSAPGTALYTMTIPGWTWSARRVAPSCITLLTAASKQTMILYNSTTLLAMCYTPSLPVCHSLLFCCNPDRF
jgi:hypothetical protein